MLASALSQQKRIYRHVLLQNVPQLLRFLQNQLHACGGCYAPWKMIGMRRGLWGRGKISRPNQSFPRESTDLGLSVFLPSSAWSVPIVSSSTSASRIQTYDQMPAAEEAKCSSPVSKRAKLDVDMPPPHSAVLRFAKLSEHATTPKRGSKHAAGYDLYSSQDCVIPAQGKETVMTDIQIALPEGCYGRVAPRSGLARKNHIDVGAGVIDRDYRGNVGVVLFNHSKEDFKVEKGHRIAQLICERIIYPELEEVKELSKTERGSAGYGSTGSN